MSTNKKVILLDDINNKNNTLFVPPDDYNKIHEDADYASTLLVEYSKAGKVQVSDTQPVDLEKLNASSIEKQIPLPTTNNCLQESVIDLTEASQHDQENASTLRDELRFHRSRFCHCFLLVAGAICSASAKKHATFQSSF